MHCVEKSHPDFMCKAKCILTRREDGSFQLAHRKGEHIHTTNKAAVIADEMKQKMVEIVKEDPTTPVGDAIKAVKKEMAEEFGEFGSTENIT